MNTVSTLNNTVNRTWDTHPFNLVNINANYLTYDKTDGEQMIE